jgi:hypothetical protein
MAMMVLLHELPVSNRVLYVLQDVSVTEGRLNSLEYAKSYRKWMSQEKSAKKAQRVALSKAFLESTLLRFFRC